MEHSNGGGQKGGVAELWKRQISELYGRITKSDLAS